MDFIAAVVAIVALVFVLKMRKRVTDLELRIAQFTGLPPAPPQTAPETPPVTAQPWAPAAPPAAAHRLPNGWTKPRSTPSSRTPRSPLRRLRRLKNPAN